jgi:TonB family protein
MASIAALKTWEGNVVDGKFPLRQWLGGSEHSAVFLTERAGNTPTKAAIKLIAAEGADSDRQLPAWRAAAQLAHPSLIRIFDTGRTRLNGTSVLYLVMEHADEDLSQILPERALTPSEVTDMLPPLLDALSYLHGKGFVHGRVKPSNILAVGDQLKLSPDHIASLTQSPSAGQRRDVYDAPEMAAGIVSPESDLWSVGVTLVAALTQNVAFAEDGSQGRPALPESITQPFRGIARECLQLDPQRRCSIAEIRARMLPEGRSVPAIAEAPPATHFRYSWRMLIPVGVLLVLGLAWALLHRTHQPEASGPVNIQVAAPDSAKPAVTAPVLVPAPASPSENLPAARGAVVHQVLPEIPQRARNTITGTIKIVARVDVDASGAVSAAKLTSAGPSRYFADSVLKAVRQWEFAAPRVNGQPVPSQWILRFRLRRSSTQVAPELVRR